MRCAPNYLGKHQGEPTKERRAMSMFNILPGHQKTPAGLERQIAAEMNRPHPDQDLVRELKKRKLRIKEELAHI